MPGGDSERHGPSDSSCSAVSPTSYNRLVGRAQPRGRPPGASAWTRDEFLRRAAGAAAGAVPVRGVRGLADGLLGAAPAAGAAVGRLARVVARPDRPPLARGPPPPGRGTR